MTNAIPDLWADINVDVVSPIAILNAQAGYLQQKSKGYLEAEVSTLDQGDYVCHTLSLVAPALNRQRTELLSVTHGKELPYPVWVDARAFSDPNYLIPGPPRVAVEDEANEPDGRRAYTQADFEGFVRAALRYPKLVAHINSLIYRSKEGLLSAGSSTPNN